MVVRRRKRITRLRGSRTQGFGSHKKHRGAGSRGGRGKSGLQKHKKSWMLINEPDHFGKGGFKIPVGAKKQILAITLKDIDILAKKMKKTEIDVSELGYDKVLSTGKITQPLTIKAKKIVDKAKKKIEEAGGKVIEDA
ncbi:MAG: uL15 family ribosomal protein [Candidatus Aenigmatarchaeota archaeon]